MPELSGKMCVLMRLLAQVRQSDRTDRVVVVSQYTQVCMLYGFFFKKKKKQKAKKFTF